MSMLHISTICPDYHSAQIKTAYRFRKRCALREIANIQGKRGGERGQHEQKEHPEFVLGVTHTVQNFSEKEVTADRIIRRCQELTEGETNLPCSF